MAMDLGEVGFCNIMAKVLLELGLERIRNMERETLVLAIVGVLMVPCIFGSLWSLGITILWEVFWLGMRFGLFLFLVSLAYIGFVTVKGSLSWKKIMISGLVGAFGNGWGQNHESQSDDVAEMEEDGGPKMKCTLMDAMLSVFFQMGLDMPGFVWDAGMTLLLGSRPDTTTDETDGATSNFLVDDADDAMAIPSGDEDDEENEDFDTAYLGGMDPDYYHGMAQTQALTQLCFQLNELRRMKASTEAEDSDNDSNMEADSGHKSDIGRPPIPPNAVRVGGRRRRGRARRGRSAATSY